VHFLYYLKDLQNLTTIWRLENDKGEGPFRYGNPLMLRATYQQFNCENLCDVHQIPQNDGLMKAKLNELREGDIDENLNWRYGFASLEDYSTWFPVVELNQFLFQSGFNLRAYQVASESIVDGEGQCMFYRPEAQLLCCDRDLSVT
jgi:hypothetical protein